MKLKYITAWTPRDGCNPNNLDDPNAVIYPWVRGDEEREFTVDGIEGYMTVSESMGGWNHHVYIEEEIIGSNRSWGERRKSEAMRLAGRVVRTWMRCKAVE